MQPTAEQEAIINASKSCDTSLMVNAMAGCAKTSSLEMLAKVLPIKPSLAVAFNKKIAKEMEKRLPKHFEVMTLNGLGHRAWSRTIGKRCGVNTNKLFETLRETFKDLNLPNGNGSWATVSSLVRGARHVGLVPKPLTQQFRGLVPDDWPAWEAIADHYYLDISDDLVWAARRTLSAMVKKAFHGDIDYDDQIYCSSLLGGIFPKFSIVMVDEAQDLSPLNHIQMRKVTGDRAIVVGDPRQAIYAFRGADSSSMASLRNMRDTWLEFPLSTTFRCPKAIVARQQIHAPGFTAADTAPEGEIDDWTSKESWQISSLKPTDMAQHLAILCRNNAPIIAAALRIIRSGYGCTVLGSEIGKSLVTLSKKILPNDSTDSKDCGQKIEEWRTSQISLAQANNKIEKISIISDRADCLLVVLDSGGALTSGELRDTLTTMFSKENNNITLSTIHKAKGLEWDTVIHLDPWRLPSKWARKAQAEGNGVPMKQEMNLNYVCETRTKRRLILANLEGMK